jgi:hypothetical protein
MVGGSGPFVIAAAGEIACPVPPFPDANPDACQYDDTADLIRPGELAAVLALGDNQYDNGSYEDYLAYYDSEWGRAKSITKPVPGNHEYAAPPPAIPDGYFRYFGDSVRGPDGQGYYSFDLGACPKARAGISSRSTPSCVWLREDAGPLRKGASRARAIGCIGG